MNSMDNFSSTINFNSFIDNYESDSDNTNSNESYQSNESTNSSKIFDKIYDSSTYNLHISHYRRKQKKKQKDRNILNEENKKIETNYKNNGYISNYTKDTPLINYLINKRIYYCHMGASSHIAAFIPVTINPRYCFIHNGIWKGHYG